MSRKKHAEHVNHERWLVSYADFITLLFAFFVVLFASSQTDKKKSAALASAMQTAFTQYGIFEAHAKSPSLGLSASGFMPGGSMPGGSALLSAEASAHGDLELRVRSVLAERIENGTVVVRHTREGLVLSLREAGFFSSGSAEVDSAASPLLASLAATLPDQPLRVEGHTDNIPIHNQRFRSNWELSSARANEIARLLMEHSRISPAHFSIAAYGEFHPIASNGSEAGRSQNRRVDVVLLQTAAPPTSSRPAPSQ